MSLTKVHRKMVGFAEFFGYRRPNLVYVSATQVAVENNTGTANETKIIFPDGEVRSVTEDIASAHKYRKFDITATAAFLTGTEDSGLYTGLSEAANTRYAIYAVKSVVDPTKFVLVGTTTAPIQANVSTLNTNLGLNGWVFLGYIFNGDDDGTTSDIVNFVQSGKQVLFLNVAVGATRNMTGIRLATISSGASCTYTYASGMATTQIPPTILMAYYGGDLTTSAGAEVLGMGNAAQSILYYVTGWPSSQPRPSMSLWMPASGGAAIYTGEGNQVGDIFLVGYIDGAL